MENLDENKGIQGEESQFNEIQSPDSNLSTPILDQSYDDQVTKQNLPLALLFGLVAALVGAFIWAFITVLTNYQIGYMAIGVGLMVGFAVGYGGKGVELHFGIIGAVLAIFGCLLGNYFSVIGSAANQANIGYFQTLGMVPLSEIPSVLAETFSGMDLLFYAFAAYAGFKYALVGGSSASQ